MITVRSKAQVLGARLVAHRHSIVEEISWQVKLNRHAWSPPTDLFETETAYVVRVEIAGVRTEDFSISFENNTLSIRGSRADLPARRAYHQMEIRSGEFNTLVAIPGLVNLEASLAEYEDGFLTVLLPKQ